MGSAPGYAVRYDWDVNPIRGDVSALHHPDGYHVPEAIERFCDGLEPLAGVEVPLREALFATLSTPVIAPRDVPDTPRSAVDGYAVRAQDTAGAAPGSPVRLRVIGSALAGHPTDQRMRPGSAVRITTGGVLPPGADAVQYQEACRVDGGIVEIAEAVRPGDNWRPAGEDTRQGQQVLAAGDLVTPERIGLLASLGIPRVTVRHRVRVRFVSLGDELHRLDESAPLGGTYESNSHQIASTLDAIGADVQCLGPVPDRADAIAEACRGEFDFLITSGGVSVGPADRIGEVARTLGAEVRFHWARLRPGAPTMGLRLGHRPWLGLSGNPLSAQVGFDLFGRRALASLLGAPPTAVPTRARLRRDFGRRAPDVPRYLRAQLSLEDGTLWAEVHPYQASGGLRAMAQTNGYVVQPEGQERLEAGDLVDALWIAPFWG